MFWAMEATIWTRSLVGHRNKLNRGFCFEKSGASPDRQARCQQLLILLQTVNPRIAIFWPHAAPPAARDQIKTKKLRVDTLVARYCPALYSFAATRANCRSIHAAHSPRQSNAVCKSAEHNERQMTAPTFEFVQIPRVYVRVFR